jgi:hypothetical protein
LFADILGSLVDRGWPVAQTLPDLVAVVLSHRYFPLNLARRSNLSSSPVEDWRVSPCCCVCQEIR